MLVTVNSQTLATELRLLAKVVPNKPAIAILSHALLTATDRLTFWATDLEVGLSSSCPASITAPGSVALPVARLLSLCEQFENGDVTLQSDGKTVTITCGAFKSRLQAMPTDDFPAMPEVDGTSYALPDIASLIARTRYAITKSNTRYMLNGALLTLKSDAAAMVATDGHRLALATASRTGTDASVIIPAKTLDMIGDATEMTISDRHLFFASGDRTLVSRTLDGQFPAYERIIPRDNSLIVTVNRGALTAALKRVVLVSEDNKAVYLTCSSGLIELSSASAEVGSAVEPVVAPCDFDLKVYVNGSYVLDFLNAARGETVTLALKDAKSAMLLTDGDDHIGVVMLLRS